MVTKALQCACVLDNRVLAMLRCFTSTTAKTRNTKVLHSASYYSSVLLILLYDSRSNYASCCRKVACEDRPTEPRPSAHLGHTEGFPGQRAQYSQAPPADSIDTSASTHCYGEARRLKAKIKQTEPFLGLCVVERGLQRPVQSPRSRREEALDYPRSAAVCSVVDGA